MRTSTQLNPTSRVYVFVDKTGVVGHQHSIEGRLSSGNMLQSNTGTGSLVFNMKSFDADTCLSLLCMFQNWSLHPTVLWKASGIAELAILVGFYGSWAALFYSLYITGMGYQTGLTQWWYWAKRQRPPQRAFVETGAYRWMRHPIYMSFLGLIWFTPTMTLDHAVLTCIWTTYIYLGSYAKDQRMLRFVGAQYREYASRIPGLPIIGFGPLLRIK